MSRAFLTTMPAFATYSGLKLEVSIAFGADLTSLTGSGWTWTDVTDDVIIGGKAGEGSGGEGDGDAVSITIGRADESTVTQTSVMKCTLDNRSGKYINTGTSAYWPYVRRGTPVRVRVTTDNGSTWSVRFQGQAVGFTPSWDKPGRWATVELEASGPLRVLDQGTLPAKSAMRYGTEHDSKVVAYWPLEDRQQSETALPVNGGDPGLFLTWDYATSSPVDGTPGEFASYANIPSSAPILALALGGNLSLPLSATTTGTSFTVSALFGNPAGVPVGGNREDLPGIPNTSVLFSVRTPNGGSIKIWELGIQASGAINLIGYNTLGARAYNGAAKVFSQNSAFNFQQNVDYEIGLTLSQSGGTTTWAMWSMEVATGVTQSFSGSRANAGAGAQASVVVVGDYSDVPGLAVGHVVVRVPSMAVGDDEDWVTGYPGEAVTTRLPRMANQSNINVDILAPGAGIYPAYTETTPASITLACGPQFWDTLSNTLRESEITGQGLLYDGLGTGLTYATRRFRQQRAAAATLTLNASSGHLMEPFDPIDDDQVLFNHYQVSRHGGNQGVEYLDVTGPEGTNIVGDHANSLTVNPNTDDGLVGYAQWGVNLGTVTGFRFPTVSFALHTNASLIPQWLACVPQSRIDVTNIASIRPQLSPDPIWLLLEGWTETISMFEWKVIANTSSAEPWVPTRLAAATGSTGDDICHMDTDSSQLNTSAALGATSISVRTNSGPLWVTSAADADSFPFYVTVGGLRVQVTAISGASSPQTFTLASPGLPAAKTGSTTPGAGAPIAIWRPPVVGL
jgi:hypothetical protein